MPHLKLFPLLPSGPWRLLVLALLLAGCSDSGTFTPADNAPLQLTLTPSDLVMNNHDTVQMEVGQRLPDGRIIPLDAPLVWTSSSPAVANVNGTGLLHARLPGEVMVKATSRWGEVSTRVTILPVSADLSLEVTDHLRVEAGSAEPVALRARIVDSAGRPVPGVRIDFSVDGSSVSLHPSSAPTGHDGYALTQVRAGETAREFDLLISSPGLEGSASGAAGPGSGGPAASSTAPGQLRKEARLEVGPSHPASLEVVPGNALMATGEERTFAAIIRDEFGNTIESDDVRWSTRNSGVAVVSSAGRVTAVAPGATEVSAEYKEGRHHVEGAAAVTVEAVAVPGPATLTLVSGSGQSAPVRDDIDGLTIRVLDEAGRPVQGVTARWRVQSGSGTMVVSATSTDGDGLSSNTFIAGTEAGPVTVRAEVEGLAAVSFDLTVEPGAAYVLDVSPSSVNLEVGETQTLSVTAQDRHGNVIPDPQPSWASSNVKVVTVDDSGRVTARGGGTAAIQAVLELAEAETAVGVETTSSGPGLDPEPEPESEPESVEPPPGISGNVRWSTDLQGLTAWWVPVEESERYRVRVFEQGAPQEWRPEPFHVTDATTFLAWPEGRIPNWGQICVRVERGELHSDEQCNSWSPPDQSEPEPESDPEEPVDAATLHISAPSTSLTSLGEAVQLEVEAHDEDGNTVSTPSITWTSSDSDVASVNSSGRVIANMIGTAVISVAAACCSGDQVSISVTQEVASVQVSPSNASMTVGGSRQFAAEALDANGNPIPDVNFDWNSTNRTVASVTSSGSVSATAEGSAGIQASTAGQVGQASVQVGSGDSAGGGSFPNEPAGWTTRMNTGFDNSQIEPLQNNWFDVANSPFGGSTAFGGEAFVGLDGHNQPVSPSRYYRAFYPRGHPEGHGAARISGSLSGQYEVGFYLAYTVRLSPDWHTTANSRYMGIKHTLPWVIPNDGSDARTMGWTNIAQNPSGDGRYHFTFVLDHNPSEGWSRAGIPIVNEGAALANKDEWVLLETIVRFDNAGSYTGLIEFFVNGVLVGRMENAPIPVDRVRSFTIAGTYGGGVGDVPHDMWYDIGHVYVSTP